MEKYYCVKEGIRALKRYIVENAGCDITPRDVELEVEAICVNDEPFIQYVLVNAIDLGRKGCDVKDTIYEALNDAHGI